MTETDAGAAPQWRVVRNDAQQYSVWLAGRRLPAGWHDVGVGGISRDLVAGLLGVPEHDFAINQILRATQ